MTIQDIIRYCEANSVAYELNGAATHLGYCDEKFEDYMHFSYERTNCRIGLEFKKDVYYWFMAFEIDAEERVFFVERYNRVNGASQKSWNKGYEAEKIIMA